MPARYHMVGICRPFFLRWTVGSLSDGEPINRTPQLVALREQLELHPRRRVLRPCKETLK